MRATVPATLSAAFLESEPPVKPEADAVIDWLREACTSYELVPFAVLRASGDDKWPMSAKDEVELHRWLHDTNRLSPLPREPAALANVLEVSVVDFLVERLATEEGVTARRGTERGYPDIEVSVGSTHFAVDFKAARRNKSRKATDSRITLCTGNTYFRYPQLHWPQTFRPFQDYAAHIDLIAIYTLDEVSVSRVQDLEFIAYEMWRLASKQRSSTTREYIGAVQQLDALREGRGVFATEREFLEFWRRFPFKIGRTVQQQLDKLLRDR